MKRIAIAYETEQGGQASLVAFEDALSVADLSPVAEILVAGNGSNAKDVVASLEALKPQAVLLATSGSATLEILKVLPRDPASGLLQVYGACDGRRRQRAWGATRRCPPAPGYRSCRPPL